MLLSPIFEYQIINIMTVMIVGLIFGSFASALTYRIPRNLPWATKGGQGAGNNTEHGLRSACTSCKTALTPRDLIPIVSWALSKGKCRHCAAPVSRVYPICEITTLIGCIGVYSVFGLTWLSLPFFIMLPFLVALIMIDFKHLILPNQLVSILAVLGAIVVLMRVWTDVIEADINIEDIFIMYIGGGIIYGAFAWGLGAIMHKVLKKEALGFGDVKFFAVSGLWLGLPALGAFSLGAGVFGVFLGVLWKKMTGSDVFPFGPALIVSFYVVLLLQGSQIL